MKCVVHAEIITVPLKGVWWIWRERHRVCFWLNGYEQLQINQPWGQKTAKSFSRLLFPLRVSLEWSIQKNQDSNLLEQIGHVAAGLRGLKLQLKQLVTVCAEEFTSTMWTIPRWGSSGEEYSLSMNTRVIWLPCRTTKNSRWERILSGRGFILNLYVWVHVCVSVYVSIETQFLGYLCVLHLENDVGPGGFCRQRQHVTSHGLSVETIPQ